MYMGHDTLRLASSCHVMRQYNAMRCDAVRCNAMQCNAMQSYLMEEMIWKPIRTAIKFIIYVSIHRHVLIVFLPN